MSRLQKFHKNWRRVALSAALLTGVAALVNAADTGYAAKKPIIAGACKQCVWGPLSDFVKEAMKGTGYDVQVCYNCNQADSPRFVAKTMETRPLKGHDIELGSPPPPQGRVDFGITESQMLVWSYNGTYMYEKDGPQPQLRMVARIEDPVYFLIAAKKSSGITDLKQLRDRKGLKILTDGGPWLDPVFAYYGITKEQVESRGGRFDGEAMLPKKNHDFDVLVSSLGGIGNNLEVNVWAEMSEKYELVYFPLPDDLRAQLVKLWDGVATDLPIQFLRGVQQPIPTVGRSGHVVYGRTDMPDEFAYLLAKSIDQHRGRLKWLNRPYSYDSRTVWKNLNVPLHPGAARYYKEMGYMK